MKKTIVIDDIGIDELPLDQCMIQATGNEQSTNTNPTAIVALTVTTNQEEKKQEDVPQQWTPLTGSDDDKTNNNGVKGNFPKELLELKAKIAARLSGLGSL